MLICFNFCGSPIEVPIAFAKKNIRKMTMASPKTNKVNLILQLLSFLINLLQTVYCIVSIHLYSASCSAHQSEALPCSARDVERREQSCENEKRHLAHQLIRRVCQRGELVPKCRDNDCKGLCLSHRNVFCKQKEQL